MAESDAEFIMELGGLSPVVIAGDKLVIVDYERTNGRQWTGDIVDHKGKLLHEGHREYCNNRKQSCVNQ